tara:strand:- start:314 stop:544 length:231 start_codon:yes stop_codon:yes gene_type:complete
MNDQIDIKLINLENHLNKLEGEFLEFRYDIDRQIEMLDSTKVVHRDEINTLKKKYKDLRDVWDKTVLDIIRKGEHG